MHVDQRPARACRTVGQSTAGVRADPGRVVALPPGPTVHDRLRTAACEHV